MAAQEPILAFVPGSFCFTSIYNNALEKFTALGHTIKPIELRSVGKKPGPLPTIHDDAAAIASELTKLADEGKEIVLVGHSYGGIPVSQCMEGLSKAAREKEGKKGGVVRIGYMTALVPVVGANAVTQMEGCPALPTQPDEEGWLHQNDHAATAKAVYNHLPEAEGLEWIKQFSQHSSATFMGELTYAGYKDVPTSYLFCEEDMCVLPLCQQRGIDNIEKASGRKVDVTRIKSDHAPTCSHLEESVSWLVGLVEKGGKE